MSEQRFKRGAGTKSFVRAGRGAKSKGGLNDLSYFEPNFPTWEATCKGGEIFTDQVKQTSI